MSKNQNEILHKIFAKLPLCSFFVIIFYLYTVYMTTYVGKLLANTYNYHEGEERNPLITLLVSMNSVTSYTKSLISQSQSTGSSLSNYEQKGVIFFVISHVLLLLLFISVIRTIFTPPGCVPEEWNLLAEDELSIAIERERALLREKLKKKQDLKSKEPTPRPTVGTPTKKETEEKPIVLEVAQDATVTQGSQGELGQDEDARLKDPNVIEQLNQVAFYNAMKKENKRFCSHCQMFKPERTHHCRQCNRCVLKMDHHCPWVSNCIGFMNYKFFVNMVLYGVILLWFLVGTYTELVVDSLFNPNVDSFYLLLIFFTYILMIMLGIIVTGFFCFHLWLIIKGKSTLEFVEEKKAADYNRGVWNNIKLCLGSNFVFWCIPIAPHFEGHKGLYFTSKPAPYPA